MADDVITAGGKTFRTRTQSKGADNTTPMGELLADDVLGTARQLAVTTATARVALSAGCAKISVLARGCDMRFALGLAGVVTADAAASTWLGQDQYWTFQINPDLHTAVAAIAIAGSGTLEIQELI